LPFRTILIRISALVVRAAVIRPTIGLLLQILLRPITMFMRRLQTGGSLCPWMGDRLTTRMIVVVQLCLVVFITMDTQRVQTLLPSLIRIPFLQLRRLTLKWTFWIPMVIALFQFLSPIKVGTPLRLCRTILSITVTRVCLSRWERQRQILGL
jgi:hypothetical protein